ncbi:MAG: IPTL-CTERM sorting domain-containing protein [Thermodesulfobacteriota bacterium]
MSILSIYSLKLKQALTIKSLLFLPLILFFSFHSAFSAEVINVPSSDTPALIQAIIDAEGDPDETTINLGGGTYTLTAINNSIIADVGLPIITTNVIINGNGSRIHRSDAPGTPEFRILIFDDDENTLTINDLTISNGIANSFGAGGLANQSDGTVNIHNSVIENNLLTNSFGAGGLSNNSNGTMNIYDSIIQDNRSISSSSLASGVNNNSNGLMTITRTTVRRNITESIAFFVSGGGVHNNSNGDMFITESAIYDNMGIRGGGLNNNSNGNVTVVNTTLSNNTAIDEGGNIFNNSNGDIFIDSSTISEGNSQSNEGSNIFDRDSDGQIFLLNTIIANPVVGTNCAGAPIVSDGYNMETQNTCNLNAVGDQPNTNPMLGPLAVDGGPTATHALSNDSPAIDTGNVNCPPPGTDQRGIIRPQLSRCDIGAYEFSVDSVPTMSEWGLIFLAAFIGLISLYTIRRKAHSA